MHINNEAMVVREALESMQPQLTDPQVPEAWRPGAAMGDTNSLIVSATMTLSDTRSTSSFACLRYIYMVGDIEAGH